MWINRLQSLDLKQNKYSQYGEEIIIQEIFRNIKTTNKYFVDIGAGGAGRNLSNTRLLLEQEWSGLSFDMDGSEGTIKIFITPENVAPVLDKYNCLQEFDFLSVDLDSFDYDIIDNILKFYSPRVICCEYNATLDPNLPLKLKYEEGYTWDGTNKYGFSYSAGVNLLQKHGYTVVLNHADTNIIAIRTDIIKPYVDFIRVQKAKVNKYHPINPNAKWETV